jgi:hypothetical protein
MARLKTKAGVNRKLSLRTSHLSLSLTGASLTRPDAGEFFFSAISSPHFLSSTPGKVYLKDGPLLQAICLTKRILS